MINATARTNTKKGWIGTSRIVVQYFAFPSSDDDLDIFVQVSAFFERMGREIHRLKEKKTIVSILLGRQPVRACTM